MHGLEGLSKGFTILYASFLNKPLPNRKLAFMKKVLSHNLDAHVLCHMLQMVTHRTCVRLHLGPLPGLEWLGQTQLVYWPCRCPTQRLFPVPAKRNKLCAQRSCNGT